MTENLREWRVVVHWHGDIGSVIERNEELARCAALSKFAEEGNRYVRNALKPAIYDDDTFDVKPS